MNDFSYIDCICKHLEAFEKEEERKIHKGGGIIKDLVTIVAFNRY